MNDLTTYGTAEFKSLMDFHDSLKEGLTLDQRNEYIDHYNNNFHYYHGAYENHSESDMLKYKESMLRARRLATSKTINGGLAKTLIGTLVIAGLLVLYLS